MTCSLVTRLDDNLRFAFLSALVKGLSFVFFFGSWLFA